MSPPALPQNPLILRPGARATRVLKEHDALVLEVPMPWLSGPRTEVFAHGPLIFEDDGLYIAGNKDSLSGMAIAPEGQNPGTAARQLYERILQQIGDKSLHRVWNYIPEINSEQAGVENYRAFNAGRHEAFSTAYGADFARRLPAASALGIHGNQLALCFRAGTASACHFENPAQVPAFKYPPEHGPTPPSFARGTTVQHPTGTSWFLSGTASIKGHATSGTDFMDQARLTFENVALMLQIMNLNPDASGQWKIFLRNRRDLEACRKSLATVFPGALDETMLLEAEICRKSLLLEVEASFHLPAATSRRSAVSPALSSAPVL